jgi:hypothetical protein
LEKERKIKLLSTHILSKASHLQDEILDALAKPPAAIWPVFTSLLLMYAPVKSLVYSSKKHKNLMDRIYCIKGVLEINKSIYLSQRDCMHFAQLYLAGNSTAGWQKVCKKNREPKHTWAATKDLL